MPALAQPLAGKVALVTGSGRGIGRAISLELASRGADLVLNYVSSASAAEATADEIRKLGRQAVAIKANVSVPEEIYSLFEQAIKQYGHLDIVVSNSGVEHFGNVLDVKPQDFDRVFNINTRGQFFVGQQAYKYLTEGGVLVLLSSISAQAHGIKGHAVYAGSKLAVQAFARCFALDFGDKKIRVNSISPGGIKSDMFAKNARYYTPNGENLTDEQIEEKSAQSGPLGRLGFPEDVARVVASLAGPDGGWINGQNITISGGQIVA